MNNYKAVTVEGIGLSGVLGVIFITLKLTGSINWSWWWVLSPFWLPWAVALATVLLVLIGVVIVSAAKTAMEEIRK